MELPVLADPNPRILPPLVVVVLTHASMVKRFGPAMAVELAPVPAVVPLNEVALSVSPVIAPATPRVTPEASVMLLPPTRSAAVLPLASPSRQ